MPRVTFISPLPAKWKVFSVICVDGSPMLWAARRPTASPGSHSERCHFSCSKFLNLETWGTAGIRDKYQTAHHTTRHQIHKALVGSLFELLRFATRTPCVLARPVTKAFEQ